jgi:hypothetical protein
MQSSTNSDLSFAPQHLFLAIVNLALHVAPLPEPGSFILVNGERS